MRSIVKAIGISFYLLFMVGMAFASSADILTKNVDSKIIDKLAGYTKYSVKVDATNYGESAKVFIKVKAIDFGGHELDSTRLMATLQKFDSKSLTGTIMIKSEIADKIYRWEIDRIDAYAQR